ncbi:lamin tail domain-containing protein [Halorarum salinum]|uniref:Lamin tail domain-containing protein n=1 Tax=Halorarum salinum TaxID=2743089 RepID=A0A7D5Q8K5_9EURY|nr:lamin tail domain-containing protein [Halobaculum salinum]QLG61076.1 lamin tail domain-containing protein [Halobaculum salinum]
MLGRRGGLIVAIVVLVALSGCAGGLGAGPTSETPTDASTQTPASDPPQLQGDENGTLEVHYINVGQGASTVLITPDGETMLIDSGDWRDDGEYVLTALNRLGIDRIDHLVTSHADADHIGGHAAIINHYETERDGIGAVYDPGITSSSQTYADYLDAIEEHEVPLYETREGDSLPLDGVNATVLGPPEPYLAGEDRNENSLVLYVQHGETSFLFPGDAEAEHEAHIAETYGDRLNVTVLQAGHHGSSSSTGEELLDATSPQIAVISSAFDSQYDHPHTETLERLADREIPTLWTATHGTVAVRSNGTAVEVWTQQAAPTTATDLRDGSPIEPGSDAQLELQLTVGGALADGGIDTTETPTTETTTPPDSQSESLSLVDVHADAAGNDNENLNDEYVVFENTGDDPLDLSGWQVADAADHTYTVPDGFTLEPGERVTLYSGSGTNTDSELYWGAERAIWNNGGDTVVVTHSDGRLVLEEDYQ